MNLGLQNKTALVTAASKGIGKACAASLIQEGCKVMISSSNKDNLISASKELSEQYNKEVLWQECNVRVGEEIRSTVNEAINTFGKIDILINNCGGPVSGPLESFSDDDWTGAFEEVLMSVVRFSREVSELMKQNKFGRIINITSISVKQPIQRLVLSNSFRSGVTAYAKTLSTDLAPFNITVNNIAPGYTLTNRIYDLAVEQSKSQNTSYEEILKNFTKDVPMGRMANPEEIGSLAAFLCSDKAAYITGQTIAVDGGYIKSIF